jgi:predicted dehydrogenase
MADAYRMSEVVELAACFTRSATRRKQFAADFSCDEVESLDELLSRDDIEGIVVTVPNDQHAPVIEAAAAAGKHVYVEKPVAVETAHIKRIADAIHGSGIVFSCGHSARRLAGIREMRRCLDTGEIGFPSMVEVVFSNERGLELKGGDWRGDPAQCPGGPLTQLGVHQIDNLNYLFGIPDRVMAIGRRGLASVPNTMVVGALLEYEAIVAYLGADWLTPGAFTVDLYCSQARLRYEVDFGWWSNSAHTDAHTRLLKVEIGTDSMDPDGRILSESPVSLAPRDHLREEIEEFGNAIRGTAQVEVGLSVAIDNVAVMLATSRSIEQQRSVDVAEVVEELRS